MVTMQGISPVSGEWGTAELLMLPPGKFFAPVLQHWLVTAPHFSTQQAQYVMALTSLADFPGVPAVRSRHFPAATHEVTILPVHPVMAGRLTPASAAAYLARRKVPCLPGEPAYIQVQATDAEVQALGPMIAEGVTVHGWTPDICADPATLMPSWRVSVGNLLGVIRERPPVLTEVREPAGTGWVT